MYKTGLFITKDTEIFNSKSIMSYKYENNTGLHWKNKFSGKYLTLNLQCFLNNRRVYLKALNKLILIIIIFQNSFRTYFTRYAPPPYHTNCMKTKICSYVSMLPGGDETMLHSVHIVGIRRLAISDSPVSICWRIRWWSYPTTVVGRIIGLHPAVVDVVSRGIPHSERVNTLHCRDLTLFEGLW